MQRRDMLERIAAVGTVGAIAGCLGGDGDEPAANDGSGLALDGEPSIETISADCRNDSTEETRDWQVDSEGTISYNGTILTSDPCHEATVTNWSADEESNTITLDVGAQSSGKDVCRQCTGAVSYQGTVQYTGGSDPTLQINHQAESDSDSGSDAEI